jgi:hypothetical protein
MNHPSYQSVRTVTTHILMATSPKMAPSCNFCTRPSIIRFSIARGIATTTRNIREPIHYMKCCRDRLTDHIRYTVKNNPCNLHGYEHRGTFDFTNHFLRISDWSTSIAILYLPGFTTSCTRPQGNSRIKIVAVKLNVM